MSRLAHDFSVIAGLGFSKRYLQPSQHSGPTFQPSDVFYYMPPRSPEPHAVVAGVCCWCPWAREARAVLITSESQRSHLQKTTRCQPVLHRSPTLPRPFILVFSVSPACTRRHNPLGNTSRTVCSFRSRTLAPTSYHIYMSKKARVSATL